MWIFLFLHHRSLTLLCLSECAPSKLLLWSFTFSFKDPLEKLTFSSVAAPYFSLYLISTERQLGILPVALISFPVSPCTFLRPHATCLCNVKTFFGSNCIRNIVALSLNSSAFLDPNWHTHKFILALSLTSALAVLQTKSSSHARWGNNSFLYQTVCLIKKDIQAKCWGFVPNNWVFLDKNFMEHQKRPTKVTKNTQPTSQPPPSMKNCGDTKS